MIAIINYEAGNLTSVQRTLTRLGAKSVITQDLGEIAQAERVIFPGVGAGRRGYELAQVLGSGSGPERRSGQRQAGVGHLPGHPIIFESSEEDLATCLGILPGCTVRFPMEHKDAAGVALKMPHMGRNRVRWQRRAHPVFAELPPEAEFYFVHSYYPAPARPADVLGLTEYGLLFASAVARANLVAVQFHPEKSGRPGLSILRNFIAWDGKEGASA